MASTKQSKQSPSDTAQHVPSKEHYRILLTRRLAAVIGALAIGVLYLALPGHLILGPNWLLLVIEAVLVLPLLFSWVTNRPLSYMAIRTLTLALLGVVTAGLAVSIALLIITLPTNKQAAVLLRAAALLWCSNVLVFALWYWEVDGGGPHNRHMAGHLAADFMFPQQVDGDVGNWAPHFVDYLFVAFTGATALSPADTFPLTRAAKMLMMLEASLSLIITVLLAARAVNILGG